MQPVDLVTLKTIRKNSLVERYMKQGTAFIGHIGAIEHDWFLFSVMIF